MAPVAGSLPNGPASVEHPATGERFTVSADGLTVSEVGGRTQRAQYIVGSGSHTRSLVYFERPTPDTRRAALMPLTWYRAAGWGLSPGYDVPDHPGFHRAMNLECLTCHDDPATTAVGDDERFTEPLPAGIGCARCHGDARAHVAARLAGKAVPPVMPDRLDPALGADVCGQCHLQGAVRLLRAGRRWDEVLPGRPLGEVVAVFAHETPGAGIGIASHAERLRRSACAQSNPEAGRCTTCHAPHPTGPRPDRSAACRSCHAPAAKGTGHQGSACTGPEPAGEDCAGCHMARTATDDIPHVSMTDHFIRRVPEADRAPRDSGPLVWINRPANVPEPIARRLLGRAWAESARARVSTADRQQALALLEPALAEAPDDPAAWADLASMKTLASDAAGARAALEEAVRRAGAGARAQWFADLARLRVQTGAFEAAADAVREARTRRPNHPDDHLVSAQLAATRGDGATVKAEIDAYEKDRGDTADGLMLRGALARAAIDPAAAEAAFAEAAARAPGDPRPALELCRLRADRHRWEGADEACAAAARSARGAQAVARVAAARARVAFGRGQHAEAARLATAGLDAAPADAALVLGRLALAEGRRDDALTRLDRAVRLDPTLADGWSALAEVLRARGETALADRAAAQARRMGAP